jgi:hypothetical protein
LGIYPRGERGWGRNVPRKRSWGSPRGSFFVAGTGMGSYSPAGNSRLPSLLKTRVRAFTVITVPPAYLPPRAASSPTRAASFPGCRDAAYYAQLSPPHAAVAEMNVRLPLHQQRPSQNPRRAALAQILRVARAASLPRLPRCIPLPQLLSPTKPSTRGFNGAPARAHPSFNAGSRPIATNGAPNPRRAASTEP